MDFTLRYAKALIIWTIVFAISQLIPSLISNEWLSLEFYFLGSFISGVVTASILSTIHLFQLKKLGIKVPMKEDLSPVQMNKIKIKHSKNGVLAIASDLFNKNFRETANNVFQSTSFNWYGWNKTTLEFGNERELKITVRPVLSTTFFDYAQNLKTIKMLEKALS